MKINLIIACCFLLMQTNGIAQKTATPKEKDNLLAGKTFTVELTDKNAKKKDKPTADEISFKGGKLNSKFMSAENKFPASVYTAQSDSSSSGNDISFSAEGKNPDGEEIKWQGTVSGEAIEGTAVISKKGKTKKEYSFSGNLKTKSKK